MFNNMTVTTQKMFSEATSRRLSIQEAVALLKNEMKPRTLSDKLEYYAKGRNIRALLVEGLAKNHPDKKRDSMERKVRDWFNKNDRFIRKEDAIELCFVLDLSVEEADTFLAMTSEEGFHWRDPDEIIYIYALKHGMDYLQACALREQMQPYLKPTKESTAPEDDSFTSVVRLEVERLNTVEELADYLQRASGKLGRYHNSAYKLFNEYMDLLEGAEMDDGLPEEKRMTTKDIVEQYLYKRVIPRSKRGDKKAGADQNVLSAIQRSVWTNWPDEITLSRMKNRAADVTRKVMILLFLATDGGESEWDEDLLEDMTPEESFEDAYMRINQMLEYCGFSPIDPRAPFDWMMLYCLCVDDMIDMDAQMEAFLQELFNTGE